MIAEEKYEALRRLTVKQRQAHDAFWLLYHAGEDCGAKSIASLLGGPWNIARADSNLKILRRRFALIPGRQAGSHNRPSEWDDPRFMCQFPGWHRDDEYPVSAPEPTQPEPLPTAPVETCAHDVWVALQQADQPVGLLALAESLDESPRRVRALLEEIKDHVEAAGEGWRVRVKPPLPKTKGSSGFSVGKLPSPLPTIEEIIAHRKQRFSQKAKAEEARRLVSIDIEVDGPIGILHMGDPHVDDDGCDIEILERDIRLIQETEGLFGANVGDSNNNWTGRLAHLYGEQSTSAQEAWMLTEWLVRSVHWLYLLKGNHGIWSGAGDPLDWMVSKDTVMEGWGARLNLRFPSGRSVRINARHDFQGSSQWNPAHGPMKAVQLGWRDHILTCGHRHESGYGILKDPASGLISHSLRIAGYKVFDRYAKEKGLSNQNVSPSVVTIIDPRWEDDDPRLITVLWSAENGARYLEWLRAEAMAGRKVA